MNCRLECYVHHLTLQAPLQTPGWEMCLGPGSNLDNHVSPSLADQHATHYAIRGSRTDNESASDYTK